MAAFGRGLQVEAAQIRQRLQRVALLLRAVARAAQFLGHAGVGAMEVVVAEGVQPPGDLLHLVRAGVGDPDVVVLVEGAGPADDTPGGPFVVLAIGGQGVVDGLPRPVGLACAVEELLVLLELLQDVRQVLLVVRETGDVSCVEAEVKSKHGGSIRGHPGVRTEPSLVDVIF